MNLDTLRLFVDTARKLSFAAVAEAHEVNPSSVSRTIAQLEKHLGFRLFQRTTRTMTLTESGEIYLQRVEDILNKLDEAEEQARRVHAEPVGTLRMTSSISFGEHIIVPLLPTFRHNYPSLKLELLFTDANLDLVSDNIDLAIRFGRGITGNVIVSKLFSTTYRIVASKEYLKRFPVAKDPEDLKHHRCTVYALPGFRSEWSFRLRQAGKDASVKKVQIQSGTVLASMLSLRSVVLGGDGPALLPDWMVGSDIAKGNLVDLFPEYEATARDFDTAAWLVYPSRDYLPHKVRVMIEFLKEHVAGLLRVSSARGRSH